MNTKAIFSSARHNWKTPDKVYADLDAEFNFNFDPCPPNHEFNGLECEWGTSNFLNPPYREIKAWLQKAIFEHRKGKTVVALLPSRTGTDWFHSCVLPHATEIRFVRGRLQFDDCGVNAPFDSMLVIYNCEPPGSSNWASMKVPHATQRFLALQSGEHVKPSTPQSPTRCE